MKTGLRWMTGAAVGAALMVGSVGSAQARPRWDRGWDDRGWGDHGWRHDRYRDRSGFGLGDALGVAALVGAAAIVATSVSKDRKAARGYDDRDAPPPQEGTDYGSDIRGGYRDADADADFSDVAGSVAHEEQMTNACAVAARDEAEGQMGGYAEIRRMETPIATRDGYNIDGELESRTSYRGDAHAGVGTARRFTCAMKGGRVAEVYLSRDVASR